MSIAFPPRNLSGSLRRCCPCAVRAVDKNRVSYYTESITAEHKKRRCLPLKTMRKAKNFMSAPRKKLGLLPKLIIAIVLGLVVGTLARKANLPVIIRIGATFNSIFGNFLGFCIPLIITRLRRGQDPRHHRRHCLSLHPDLRYLRLSGGQRHFPVLPQNRFHRHGQRPERGGHHALRPLHR